ncbi:MAG: hypothetical protein JOZ25_03645 [Actinobacteria bacterium]|nr:hypothetical protein [Actinomycetota bacterium]
MAARRHTCVAAACAIAALTAAGCSSGRPDGAGREGKPVKVAGLSYNVYITRQLNLRDAEDRGYYRAHDPPPGYALYGLFLSVCNDGNGFRRPLTRFTIEDNQGNKFHPVPLPKDNLFAFRPRRLSHNGCIPEPGSTAYSGPAGGALLVFRFPLTSLENRPLELLIQNRAAPGATPQTKRVELDI